MVRDGHSLSRCTKLSWANSARVHTHQRVHTSLRVRGAHASGGLHAQGGRLQSSCAALLPSPATTGGTLPKNVLFLWQLYAPGRYAAWQATSDCHTGQQPCYPVGMQPSQPTHLMAMLFCSRVPISSSLPLPSCLTGRIMRAECVNKKMPGNTPLWVKGMCTTCGAQSREGPRHICVYVWVHNVYMCVCACAQWHCACVFSCTMCVFYKLQHK